jgi:oligopeptide/dipeptide ABC transporter ATP-binding protein
MIAHPFGAEHSAEGVSHQDGISPLVEAVDVHVRFPSGGGRAGAQGAVRAVDGVSLAILPGETLGLVGESGCGKSTLGRALLHLVEVASGSIHFGGQEVTTVRRRQLSALRRKAQIIFQDSAGSLNPRQHVGELVRAGLDIHRIGKPGERDEQVAQMLTRVGLAGMERRLPHELSGGQRQRVGIARALVMSPTFVVADEPISALDVSVQSQVLNLLAQTKRELGLTLLFISHNLAAVEYVSDRIAVMYLGKIVEVGPATEVQRNPLHPYTIALVSAAPRVKSSTDRPRIILKGDLPSASDPPSGCRFRTRCPMAQAICAQVEPALENIQADRYVACHFAGKGPS